MEDLGNPISGEELNSDIGDLKAEKLEKLKNQLFIGIGIFIELIFFVFFIIMISIKKNNENSKTNKEIFAEFDCLYDVKTISLRLFRIDYLMIMKYL